MRFWQSWQRYRSGFLLFLLMLLAVLLIVSRLALLQTSNYAAKLYGTNLPWLTAGSEIKQEFTSHYPGLDQVDIFVAKREMNSQAELVFSLRESCQAETDLYKLVATRPSGEIDGASFYSFTFSPIEASAQQKFCFVLKSGLSENDKNKLTVLASYTDVYPEGEAVYTPPLLWEANLSELNTLSASSTVFLPIIQRGEARYNHIDIGFQLHYSGRFLEMLKVFASRLVEHKPYFFGRVGFYVFLLIFYGAGVLLLIWLVVIRKILD